MDAVSVDLFSITWRLQLEFLFDFYSQEERNALAFSLKYRCIHVIHFNRKSMVCSNYRCSSWFTKSNSVSSSFIECIHMRKFSLSLFWLPHLHLLQPLKIFTFLLFWHILWSIHRIHSIITTIDTKALKNDRFYFYSNMDFDFYSLTIDTFFHNR